MPLSLSPFSCPPRWVTFYFYLMASAWPLLSEHLCITTSPPQLLIHHGFLHVDPPPSPQKLYCFHIFIPFSEREIQKRNWRNLTFPILMLFFPGTIFFLYKWGWMFYSVLSKRCLWKEENIGAHVCIPFPWHFIFEGIVLLTC